MQERWQRVFQRAPVPGGAWLHAPPLMPETGGSALLSPSLPFPTGCEEHHYLQNTKTQATVSFGFIFLRYGSFGSVTVGSASLQIGLLRPSSSSSPLLHVLRGKKEQTREWCHCWRLGRPREGRRTTLLLVFGRRCNRQ